MSTINPSDALREVIRGVSSMMPEVQVGETLPPAASLHKALPVVVMDILPADTVRTAFGGEDFPVFMDRVPVDVEVFAESRAQAFDVASKLRLVLYQLPHIEDLNVVGVDCPHFATREDLNPRVKVLGAVADVDTRP